MSNSSYKRLYKALKELHKNHSMLNLTKIFVWVIPTVRTYQIFMEFPTAKYILDLCMDVFSSYYTFHAIKYFDKSQLFLTHNTSVSKSIIDLIHYEYAYYISLTIIEMMERKKEAILHHLCALSMLYVGHSYEAFHTMLFIIFVFNTSTPFLDIAKFSKHMGYSNVQNMSFALFSFIFFMFRICILPYALYHSLTIDRTLISLTMRSYLMMNSAFVTLYGMQLVWFHRIMKIWKTQFRSLTSSNTLKQS